MANNSPEDQRSVGQSAGEAGINQAIARWRECLHSGGSFQEALQQFAESIGAEAAILSRNSQQLGRKSRVIAYDALSQRKNTMILQRSFARSVLGSHFDSSKPGSVWFRSMTGDETDPALLEFQRRRKFDKLAVIPLCSNEKSADFLELHFPVATNPASYGLLNSIADSLSQTWTNRAPGVFTEFLSRERKSSAKMTSCVPILSMENPARLSRTEFRVCLLLSRGQSIAHVQSELSISKSALRKHLRNIYAKTKTSSQSELLYKMQSYQPGENGSTAGDVS